MRLIRFIYRLYGKVLGLLGVLVRRRTRVVDGWVDSIAIETAVITQIGAIPICLDERYRVPTICEWVDIIKSDKLSRKKKYIRDVFDCDNFAIVFSAHCSEGYNINSAGIAVGRIYNAETGKFLGLHAYNILAANKDSYVRLYLYEPQTGGYVVADSKTKLGSLIYETMCVVFG